MREKRGSVILFCAAYFAAYVIRHCYAAALVEIIADLEITRSLAGVAVTGAFITYGAGQFVSGYLGDRMSPQRLFLLGFGAASAINVLIACIPDIRFMNVAWIVSGFFHSLVWAPLVRIVSHTFPVESEYRLAIRRVAQCAYAGTVATYLLAAWFVSALSWRALFLLTGVGGLAFSALWYGKTKDLKIGPAGPKALSRQSVEPLPLKMWLLSGIVPVLLVVIGIGCLRDGIATWMPVYMMDVFHFGSSLSILTSVVLPVCAILAVEITSARTGAGANIVRGTGWLMAGSAALAVVLRLSFAHTAVWDMCLMGLICCCLRGASFLLTSLLPRYYERYGKVSLMSGVANGSLYIGSAAATYLLAVIADRYGWDLNIAAWALISLACVLLCLTAQRSWKAFTDRASG